MWYQQFVFVDMFLFSLILVFQSLKSKGADFDRKEHYDENNLFGNGSL